MGGPDPQAMRHTRHAPPKPSSPSRPARATTRPLGLQQLDRKAWDKVRAAIRALQAAPPSS
jgi:hypothetical protein